MTESTPLPEMTVIQTYLELFTSDLDPRLHSAYDMSLYTQPAHDQFRNLASHLYGDPGHLQLEDELERHHARKMQPLLVAFNLPKPTQTLIPINHHYTADSNPTFVNPKQYEAIMRRRMKKMKLQNNYGLNRTKVKKKYKYETRSRHAKNRKRAKDGKFLSVPGQESSRTASTILRPQDEEPEEEVKVPCYAEDQEKEAANTQGKPEKKKKVKMEMDESDNLSINSDEFFGANKQQFSRRVSKREPIEQQASDELTLRKHDSLMEIKR